MFVLYFCELFSICQSLYTIHSVYLFTHDLHPADGIIRIIAKGLRVPEAVIRRFLGIYQSSSPSYLLMASIDSCLQLIRREGAERLRQLRKNLDDFYSKCASLRHIRVYSDIPNTAAEYTADAPRRCITGCTADAPHRYTAVFDRDPSKILISAPALGLSGQEISDILRQKYHLELEMASGHYALALCSLMDRPEGFVRLYDALREMDEAGSAIRGCSGETNSAIHGTCDEPVSKLLTADRLYRIPQRVLTITEALEAPSKVLPLTEAAGCISQEYIYLYPPGIPLVAPGEKIDDTLLSNIRLIRQAGLQLEGLSDLTNNRINVVIL